MVQLLFRKPVQCSENRVVKSLREIRSFDTLDRDVAYSRTAAVQCTVVRVSAMSRCDSDSDP